MDLNTNWPINFDADNKKLMVPPETLYVGMKHCTGNGENETEFTKVKNLNFLKMSYKNHK